MKGGSGGREEGGAETRLREGQMRSSGGSSTVEADPESDFICGLWCTGRETCAVGCDTLMECCAF